MKQQLAWDLGDPDKGTDKAARAERELRISDLVVGVLIPFATLRMPGSPLPANEVAALTLVGIAMTRPVPRELRTPAWLALGLCALFGELVLSDFLNDGSGLRRLGHVAIYVGLAYVVATARVSLRSFGIGLGVGLAVVGSLGAIGMGGSTYAGRLTGFFGDPNAAAYYLTVLGPIAAAQLTPSWLRRTLLVLLAAVLVLTYSRTGLLAMALGVLWLIVGRRMGILGGGGMVALLVWLVSNIPPEVKAFGPFANRSGSDALRDRIIAAEQELLAAAPWYGHGPGTATVELPGNLQFFFHNSYLAIRQEGGWPLVVIVLLLIAGGLITLTEPAQRGVMEAAWAQVALISTLVMGVTLGEVFLELPAAIAIGCAAQTALTFGQSGERRAR